MLPDSTGAPPDVFLPTLPCSTALPSCLRPPSPSQCGVRREDREETGERRRSRLPIPPHEAGSLLSAARVEDTGGWVTRDLGSSLSSDTDFLCDPWPPCSARRSPYASVSQSVIHSRAQSVIFHVFHL